MDVYLKFKLKLKLSSYFKGNKTDVSTCIQKVAAIGLKADSPDWAGMHTHK